MLFFLIKDNGMGITPEDQKRLFKNFVRLEQHNVEGYGLGLSIVKKIIEKLDGTVGIESTGNGEGSKFYFTLPLAENKSTTAYSELNPVKEINLN